MSLYVKRRGACELGVSLGKEIWERRRSKEDERSWDLGLRFQRIPTNIHALPKPSANISSKFLELKSGSSSKRTENWKSGLVKIRFKLRVDRVPPLKIRHCRRLNWSAYCHQTINLPEEYMERSSSNRNFGTSKLIIILEASSKSHKTKGRH